MILKNILKRHLKNDLTLKDDINGLSTLFKVCIDQNGSKFNNKCYKHKNGLLIGLKNGVQARNYSQRDHSLLICDENSKQTIKVCVYTHLCDMQQLAAVETL